MAPGKREEIRVGPMALHFLVEGDESAGSVAMSRVRSSRPGQESQNPHSHDGYEETIYRITRGCSPGRSTARRSTSAPARRSASPAGRSTASRNAGEVDARALRGRHAGRGLGPTTSGSSRLSPMRRPVALRIRPRSRRSCSATASPPRDERAARSSARRLQAAGHLERLPRRPLAIFRPPRFAAQAVSPRTRMRTLMIQLSESFQGRSTQNALRWTVSSAWTKGRLSARE